MDGKVFDPWTNEWVPEQPKQTPEEQSAYERGYENGYDARIWEEVEAETKLRH